jgi:hypothetical protein
MRCRNIKQVVKNIPRGVGSTRRLESREGKMKKKKEPQMFGSFGRCKQQE